MVMSDESYRHTAATSLLVIHGCCTHEFQDFLPAHISEEPAPQGYRDCGSLETLEGSGGEVRWWLDRDFLWLQLPLLVILTLLAWLSRKSTICGRCNFGQTTIPMGPYPE